VSSLIMVLLVFRLECANLDLRDTSTSWELGRMLVFSLNF
jgi:hypothetical protein